jgi:hypothetical protein
MTKEDSLTGSSPGVGVVTRKILQGRAVRLPVINGRSPQDASNPDLAPTKRESTGAPDTDPKEAAVESAPESERRDPVSGLDTRIGLAEPQTRQANVRDVTERERPEETKGFVQAP